MSPNMESPIMNISSSHDIPRHSVMADIVIGLFAGFAATLVTNLAQKPLSWVTPDSVDRHEKQVRPGATSSLVAAKRATEVLGASLSERQEELLGSTIHFGIGIGWGPVYGLLRRYAGLQLISAALTTGVAMSLILDEGLVPALGLSAPNHHYLIFTRTRGFIAHIVYGVAAALTAEGIGRLMERSLGDAEHGTESMIAKGES